MQFLDPTGHIFKLPSFNYNPIGYEYAENRHIFWIEDKTAAYLSVGNYYLKPIYLISEYPLSRVEITVKSDVFSLIGSKFVQESLSKYGYVKLDSDVLDDTDLLIYESEKLEYEYNDILEVPVTVNLNDETLDLYNERSDVYMYPFYVLGISYDEATVTSNILIMTKTRIYIADGGEDDYGEAVEYCPITVGGTWAEINEILVINGRNMGVELPAEIIKAVYEGSYVSETFNETLYNQKLKEYLINYMGIHGEIGNYNSAINSLKWFGWGKHLNIVSLFETDNQYCVQFVRDFFDINTDILESFKHFRNSTLISLIGKYNKELLDNDNNIVYEPYNLDAEFMGENQPIMEDLFKRFDKHMMGGRGEETYYWHAYYNFMFDELALKLSALKYFYEKYFLPVHISVHTAALEYKVYINDNKQLTRSNSAYTEKIIELGMDPNDEVEFPGTNIIWLNEQTHIIDNNYNEWVNPNYNSDEFYYIHDTCMNIPIKFKSDRICDVVAILEKNDIHRRSYQFYINVPLNFKSDVFFIVNEYELNGVADYMTTYPCAYSEDKDNFNNKNYTIWFNDFDTLVNHYMSTHFIDYDLINVKDDIFQLNVNDLLNKYFGYEFNLNDYVIYTEKNSTGTILNKRDKIIYLPNESQNTNIQISSETETLYLYKKIANRKTIIDIEKRPDIVISIPNLNDINVNPLPLSDTDGIHSAHTRIYIYQSVYFKFKYTRNVVDNFFINNERRMDDIFINYFPDSNVVFEKHFRFDPTIDEYGDLVIYPKLFTNVKTDEMTNEHFTEDKTQLAYWIGSYFTLRLLVNHKWYIYNFTVKIPDIQFDMGKLVYKYWDDDLKLRSRFNQLSKLEYDEYGAINLEFNSFMHETDLVTVNHINFFEDFVKYLKITNARFINGSNIRTNQTYAFIDVSYKDDDGQLHQQRIFFPSENVGSDIIVPKKYLNTDMIYFLYYRNEVFVLTDSNTINDVYSVDKVKLPDNESGFNIVGGHDFVLSIDNNISSEIDTDTQYIDINNYKIFKYDPSKHKYYIDILDEHYEYKIKLSMKESLDNFTSKYIEKHFITNNDKYKNQIHVFDLMRLDHHVDSNKLFIHNNIDFKYHGVRFKHDNYIEESKLEISGNVGDLIDDIVYRDGMNNLFESGISDSTYAGYINTYDDLTIYSAYNGDFIMKTSEPEPIGYLYYECTDIDGNLTGEIYDSPQHIVITNELIFEQDIMSIDEIRKYIYPTSQKAFVDVEQQKYLIQFNYNQYVDEYNTQQNPEYLNMYIDRRNIDDETTSLFFTLDLCKVISRDENNKVITYDIINPTRYEFFENIYDKETERFKDYGLNNLNKYDSQYRFKFKLFYKKKQILNNIEHIYTKEYNVNDVGEAWGMVNGQYIKLHPYYGDIEDNLDDTLISKEILKQQPGYYWYNVDDSFLYIDEYMEVLNVDDLYDPENFEHISKNNVKTYGKDTDISSLTKWRKYLRIDITNKILVDIKEWVPIATDSIMHYEIINDKIDEGFITVVQVTNERNQVFYNTEFFDINIIDPPKKVVVFFAIDKNGVKPDENGDFIINVMPEIRRSYYSYDILQYNPIDYVDDELSVTLNYNDGSSMMYGDLNEDSKQLYMNMFKTYTDVLNESFKITTIEAIPELNIDNGNMEYNMYLMHDDKQWYVIYISKDTCNHIITLYNFNPAKKEIYFSDVNNINKYKLKFVSSGKRFLLNRYKYVSTNGKNIFDRRDIITTRVINNNRLPIDITMSNKWEIRPLSFGVPKENTISKSNAQMCIIDAPYVNDEYYPGYYDIIYRYNIDRIANHQNKLTGRFRVI